MTTVLTTRSVLLCSLLAGASALAAQDANAATVRFQSQSTTRCLTDSTALGDRVYTEACSSTNKSQQWVWTYEGGATTFKNVGTGKCLRSINRVLSTATCSSTSIYQDFTPFVTGNPASGQPYYTTIMWAREGDITNSGCFVNFSSNIVAFRSFSICIGEAQMNHAWKTVTVAP